MDMRRLVGRNVRRIRLEKGLTQEAFAERSGFSQQYISGLERGRRNPTIVTLFELASTLGVSHVALVEPDGEEQAAKPMRRGGRRKPSTKNGPADA
jgi:transcriptional regulator with XRE-family HTH domain